jgi:L-iditol 2-dehydrogenase
MGPPIDGAFREYIAHPETFTYKIPDDLSFEEAALLEPVSVGIHATRRADIQPGDVVAILGAGPIGLVTLQAARIKGAADILVTDLVDYRLEIAKALGATNV